MVRYALIGIPALFGLCVLPAPLASQDLVPTDSAGVYRLNYVDIDGVAHSVRVEAPNRVDAELATEILSTATGYRLEITLRHLDSDRSQRPIRRFEIPCPAVTSIEGPEGWNARWTNHWSRGDHCYFSTRGPSVEPGQEVSGFVIESTLAPGATVARVFGLTDGVYWPSEAGTVPDEVYALADEVRGRTGGWLEVPIIALVGVDPPDDAGDALLGLVEELDVLCDAGAIRPAGICTSLKQKVRQARQAVERGRNEAALRILQSALNEVAALPESRIDEEARALLEERLRGVIALLEP